MTDRLRALARKNNIIKTASVGVYAKFVGILVTFAMVPLAVGYLGVEQYGLWIAVSSLIAMFSFADGGVGNALVNMVSQATGEKSTKSMNTIVSSGFFVLFSISVFGALFFLLLYSYVPWGTILGVAEAVSSGELLSLVLIVGLGFFFGMPCSVVGNVQRGLQKGNVEAFWNAKGQLLSLLLVYAAIRMDLGIIGFASAFVLGPLLSALINSSLYFFIKRKDLLPKPSFVRSKDINAILGTGGLFFILQITAVIQAKADNVIIANLLGPASVAQYAICMQLFLVVPMVMGLLWAPLWPAYREALASGDVVWIKQVFMKSMKLALAIGVPASIVLVVFGQQIVTLWVGESVVPSMLLLVGGGMWMWMLIIGSAMAMLLNGLQVIKTQIIVATSAAILNVGLSIWLINTIGVEGAVYGSVISYLVCAIIPYYFIIPRLLRDHAVRIEAK